MRVTCTLPEESFQYQEPPALPMPVPENVKKWRSERRKVEIWFLKPIHKALEEKARIKYNNQKKLNVAGIIKEAVDEYLAQPRNLPAPLRFRMIEKANAEYDGSIVRLLTEALNQLETAANNPVTKN